MSHSARPVLPPSILHRTPAVANGVVYVGSDDKNLYAYDLAAGGSGF